GINTAANKLREALGDSAENPRFVETVGRRGYRWIPDLTRSPEPGPSGPREAPAGAASERKTETRGQVPIAEARGTALHPRASLRKRIALAVLGVSALLLVALGRELVQWRNRVQALEAARGIRSIAVLPLDNLSGDPTQEYFSDGLTDELITDLARTTTIRVISRTS